MTDTPQITAPADLHGGPRGCRAGLKVQHPVGLVAVPNLDEVVEQPGRTRPGSVQQRVIHLPPRKKYHWKCVGEGQLALSRPGKDPGRSRYPIGRKKESEKLLGGLFPLSCVYDAFY